MLSPLLFCLLAQIPLSNAQVPPHASGPESSSGRASAEEATSFVRYLNGPPERIAPSSTNTPSEKVNRVYELLSRNKDLFCRSEENPGKGADPGVQAIRSLHETEVPALAKLVSEIPKEVFNDLFGSKAAAKFTAAESSDYPDLKALDEIVYRFPYTESALKAAVLLGQDFAKHSQNELARAYFEKARSYLQTQPDPELATYISFNLLKLSVFLPGEFEKEKTHFQSLLKETPRMHIGDEEVATSVIYQEGANWFKKRFPDLRPPDQPLAPPELAWSKEPLADWTWRIRRLLDVGRFREITGIPTEQENLFCLAHEFYSNPDNLNRLFSTATKLQLSSGKIFGVPLYHQLWDLLYSQLAKGPDRVRLKALLSLTPAELLGRHLELARRFPADAEMVALALKDLPIPLGENGIRDTVETLRRLLKYPQSVESLTAMGKLFERGGTAVSALSPDLIAKLNDPNLAPELAAPLLRALLVIHPRDDGPEIAKFLLRMLARFERNQPLRDQILGALPAYDEIGDFDAYTQKHPDRNLVAEMREKYVNSVGLPGLSLLPYVFRWRAEKGTPDSLKMALNRMIREMGADDSGETAKYLPLILSQLKEAPAADHDYVDSLAVLVGSFGKDARSAIPTLVKAEAERPTTSYPLLIALTQVGSTKEFLPRLLKAYPPKTAPSEIKIQVVRAIGNIGSDAKQAIPFLFQTLSEIDKDHQTKAAVLRALLAVGADSDQMMGEFEKLLEGRWSPAALCTFAQALGNRASKSTLPERLVALLESKQGRRDAAAVVSTLQLLDALTRIRPLPLEVQRQLLILARKERDPRVARAYQAVIQGIPLQMRRGRL